MDIKTALRPTSPARLIDLLQDAGITITDWKSPNDPSKCFEWAFIDKIKKVVVLNLWWDETEFSGADRMSKGNMKSIASTDELHNNTSRHARWFDECVRLAHFRGFTIRAIFQHGEPAVGNKRNPIFRKLDPLPWVVNSYSEAGEYVLQRQKDFGGFADQFSELDGLNEEPQKREVTGMAYSRSAAVRQDVLQRSCGKCEYCGLVGFETKIGTYLETHHVIPLSAGGTDSLSNVIALCPNHHREAHFGLNASKLTADFESLLCRR